MMKKIDLLLHMTEHPELYTDRQLQEMLRDDEYRALYDTMVKTKRAYIRHKMQHATVSTEQEWRRFERMYFARTGRTKRRKTAAVAAIVCLVSGLAVAAIVLPIGKSAHRSTTTAQQEQHATPPTGTNNMADSTTQHREHVAAKTFENTPLEDMLGEMAQYYNVKVVYNNASARKLRLFYEWNMADSVEQVVDVLNHFRHVNLQLNDRTITVE